MSNAELIEELRSAEKWNFGNDEPLMDLCGLAADSLESSEAEVVSLKAAAAFRDVALVASESDAFETELHCVTTGPEHRADIRTLAITAAQCGLTSADILPMAQRYLNRTEATR